MMRTLNRMDANRQVKKVWETWKIGKVKSGRPRKTWDCRNSGGKRNSVERSKRIGKRQDQLETMDKRGYKII